MFHVLNCLWFLFVWRIHFVISEIVSSPVGIFNKIKISSDGKYVFASKVSDSSGEQSKLYRYDVLNDNWNLLPIPSSNLQNYYYSTTEIHFDISSTGQIIYFSYSQSNNNNFYSNSYYVFKSTDYGNNFYQLPSQLNRFSIDIAESNDGNTVFFATSDIIYYQLQGNDFSGSYTYLNSQPLKLVCNLDCSLVIVLFSQSQYNNNYLYQYYQNKNWHSLSYSRSFMINDLAMDSTGDKIYVIYAYSSNTNLKYLGQLSLSSGDITDLQYSSSSYYSIACDSTCENIFVISSQGLAKISTSGPSTYFTPPTYLLPNLLNHTSLLHTGMMVVSPSGNGQLKFSNDFGITWNDGKLPANIPTLRPTYKPTSIISHAKPIHFEITLILGNIDLNAMSFDEIGYLKISILSSIAITTLFDSSQYSIDKFIATNSNQIEMKLILLTYLNEFQALYQTDYESLMVFSSLLLSKLYENHGEIFINHLKYHLTTSEISELIDLSTNLKISQEPNVIASLSKDHHNDGEEEGGDEEIVRILFEIASCLVIGYAGYVTYKKSHGNNTNEHQRLEVQDPDEAINPINENTNNDIELKILSENTSINSSHDHEQESEPERNSLISSEEMT